MNNFCSKCSYNLNIQKNTTNQDTRISISIIEAFEILNNNPNNELVFFLKLLNLLAYMGKSHLI